jgi:hypothetical protein
LLVVCDGRGVRVARVERVGRHVANSQTLWDVHTENKQLLWEQTLERRKFNSPREEGVNFAWSEK